MDKGFAATLLQQWKEEITGPFSAIFAAILFAVTVFALVFGLPQQTGALVAVGITAALFFFGVVSAAKRVWEKERAKVGAFHYGLMVESIQLSLDHTNKQNTLEVRPLFKNTTSSPLRYLVELMESEINHHHARVTATSVSKDRGNIIAPNSTQTFLVSAGLTARQYKEMPTRTAGRLELSVVYGHPDREFERRMRKEAKIDVFKRRKGQIAWNFVWVLEKDEPFSPS